MKIKTVSNPLQPGLSLDQCKPEEGSFLPAANSCEELLFWRWLGNDNYPTVSPGHSLQI